MVDTNILVYSVDGDEGAKHHRADSLLRDLIARRELTLSAQVLNEFYAVATRPSRSLRWSHEKAADFLRRVVAAGRIVPVTESTTLRALDAMPRHGLSFWDALIWAAAKEVGAAVLYSEDFQHGRDVEGVRFVNPFVAA